MADCPNCEYHKIRAQRWRDEAYKLSGHPLPEREWVGLTEDEIWELWNTHIEQPYPDFYVDFKNAFKVIEAKLKEKNDR
jgi:hypothetical protein